MRTQRRTFFRYLIPLFSIFVTLILISAFTGHYEKGEHFVVAKVGSDQIAKAVQSKLLKAFKANYGAKAQVEEISIVKMRRKTWVAFLGINGTPTVTIELKTFGRNMGIDLGGPLQINNCKTTSSCSCCNTSCECSKKNGGQESCGSGNCTSETTDDFLPRAMAEVLAG